MDHVVGVEQDSEQSPIHAACTSGDVSGVTACIEDTTQPRALVNKYHEGLAPLHAAALSGSARACDVMRVLLEHGAEVNAQTLGDENTALHLVVENGVFPRDFNIIAFLIENGISLSLRNRKLRTAYDCAMGLGHDDVAATLEGSVPRGQVWNVYKEKTGLRYGPCISEAVLNSDLKMLEEAIRLGGNPNIINKHGAAAIHYAVTHCSLPVMDVLEKLVDAGADVNLRDDEGDNVLNLAIKNKQLWENDQMAEVVIFLLNCGAEASFKDLDGKDAFDLAGERGYHDILEILRRPQMTPRPTTPEEETEVESEAEDKQPAADVNTPNSEGLYPIHLAVQKEESQDRTAEVDSVIQQGARVNQTIEQTGNTALHLCAVLNHSDTADQLLRHGVDLSLKNKDGKTAYDLAKERGHRGVMAVIEAKLKGTQDKMKENEKEKEKKSGSCHIL